MVQELLSRVYNYTRHIILTLLLILGPASAYSQSVLLPGDVVIVSVNASENSFDFIPLVDIKEGTSIWFSNGIWEEETHTLSDGQEVHIRAIQDIAAGTNIHINEITDPRLSVEGSLFFTGEMDRVLAYQKDEGILRFLYGVGWGSAFVWEPDSLGGSQIPASISTGTHTLLTLGERNNYQYHLRNGASGTVNMLASFVADPAKWRGRDVAAYSPFGTSFRLLNPPVVLFSESVNTVEEGGTIVLNVDIYEHDGSRLTVDVLFREDYSVADSNDIGKFRKHTYNFTGLIGNAIYTIEVPVTDDNVYEGLEAAQFELQNLSKGNFGDFVSHSSFIKDNETPNVQISGVSFSGNPESDYIELQNNERIYADLSGWKLRARGFSYEFGNATEIDAFKTLRISHPNARGEQKEGASWLQRNSSPLELFDANGKKVSELSFRRSADPASLAATSGGEPRISGEASVASRNGNLTQSEETIESEIIRSPVAGWYPVSSDEVQTNEFLNRTVYTWNESLGSFEEINSSLLSTESQQAYLTFYTLTDLEPDTTSVIDGFLDMSFEEEELFPEDSTLSAIQEALPELPATEFEFTLTSTDLDENSVINGGEGFNLLRNPLNQTIRVRSFIEYVESNLAEGFIYPYIYVWPENGWGWEDVQILSEEDEISPGSYFWVRADSLFDAVTLMYQPDAAEEFVYLGTEEEDEFFTGVTIDLSSEEGLKGSVRVQLHDVGELMPRDIVAPQFEEALSLNPESYLYLGAGNGLNWFSGINIEKLEDQRMVVPLAFAGSASGTLTMSISGWDEIPVGWTVKLKDIRTEEEYILDANWSLEFDYLAEEIEAEGDEPENTLTLDDRFQLVLLPPGVSETETVLPESVSLHQNYPNPFNPVTTISFYLPESVSVKLSVFNVVGQPVAELASGVMSEGDHTFEWDATGLPSGMYIYQLEVGNKVMTRKMTLVK